MEKYGADALRLYLINSPVVRAENLSFKEEGVKDMIKDVFIPWYNVYRFFVQNLVLFQQVFISNEYKDVVYSIHFIFSLEELYLSHWNTRRF